MKVGLSLYLDLIRFMMALEVMLGHSTSYYYTGHGFLWQIDPYKHMRTAVIGFFVLSGFVIGYVSDQKEKSGREYLASRFARMHSVIIFALALTFICDSIGSAINFQFYHTWNFPEPIGDNQPVRYALSFFYLNDTWLIPSMEPGTNGAFWTITLEVMYYLMFGLLWYVKSFYKYILVLIILAIGGPHVAILFPIWLLGLGVYHLQRRKNLPTLFALLIFFGSLIGLLYFSNMRPDSVLPPGAKASSLYPLDYVEGMLIALNIYAAAGLSTLLLSTLKPFSKSIRWLGMLTFSLYLCHLPLLNFFTVINVGEATSVLQKFWLFGGIFTVVILISYLAEWLRARLKIMSLAFAELVGMTVRKRAAWIRCLISSRMSK